MTEQRETRTDRLIGQLKDNPVVAASIVAGLAISAIASFWTGLPQSLRDTVVGVFVTRPKVSYPEGGWVFAGYADKDDHLSWATEQRVALVRPSRGRDRPLIFRVGDIVQPRRPVPQVIADYRTKGTTEQLTAPWQVKEVIHKADDYTGRIYTPSEQLEVMDVTESQIPGQDYAVWLRVAPITADKSQ
ncbi:hypothetical protein DBR17_18045 [Sphingomonas sp. HMWF008]|nr:hypothetical protein DBR17_18045 [Sphingomonas sp. HMWF008]